MSSSKDEPNQAMQPTAGRRTAALDVVRARALQLALALRPAVADLVSR